MLHQTSSRYFMLPILLAHTWKMDEIANSECVMLMTSVSTWRQGCIESMFMLSNPGYRDSSKAGPPSSHWMSLGWQSLAATQSEDKWPFSQKSAGIVNQKILYVQCIEGIKWITHFWFRWSLESCPARLLSWWQEAWTPLGILCALHCRLEIPCWSTHRQMPQWSRSLIHVAMRQHMLPALYFRAHWSIFCVLPQEAHTVATKFNDKINYGVEQWIITLFVDRKVIISFCPICGTRLSSAELTFYIINHHTSLTVSNA